MTGRFERVRPALLTAMLLVAAIAVGTTAAEALPGLDRVDDRAPDPSLDRSALAGTMTSLSESVDRTPTRDIGSVENRLSSTTDRVTGVDWGPPVTVLLFGYTRQADAEPLDHDVRERLFEQVSAAPGAHIADLVDDIDVPRSTVRYHLRVLEESGLVAGETVRGRHRYAPAGTDLELAAALYDEPTRVVLEAIARFEPVSPAGLADEVDRAPSTVAHHLDHLEAAGLIVRESADGRVEVRMDGAARDLETDRRPRVSDRAVRAELSVE